MPRLVRKLTPEELQEFQSQINNSGGGLSIVQSVVEELDRIGVSQDDWNIIFPPLDDPEVLYLEFVKLEKIPLSLAVCLGRWRNALDLSGLKELNPPTAEALSSHRGSLDLNGLETLDEDVAKHISKHVGCLSLGGLKSITPEACHWLSKIKKGNLSLIGLESLSKEAAEQLVGLKGKLLLWNLKDLSAEVAKFLSKRNDWLDLPKVRKISEETAKVLGTHQGTLNLGITELSPKATRYLSRHLGDLHLNELETITDEVAVQLSGFPGSLHLYSMKGLSPSVQSHFLGKRNIHFPYTIADRLALLEANLPQSDIDAYFLSLNEDLAGNIETIFEQMIEKGANYGDWFLLCGGTRSELFVKEFKVVVPELKRLPVEFARFLFAGYIEELIMDDLIEAEEEVLSFLDFSIFPEDGQISLKGLKALDENCAKLFADFPGTLHLGLPKMNDSTKEHLSKCRVEFWGSEDGEFELEP